MKTLFKQSTRTLLSLFLIFFYLISFSQQKEVQDTTKVNSLEEVKVASTRLNKKSPFAYSTIKKEELQKNNLGQDLPILLDQMLSVVTTSDAGTGVGYTGLRVRGSDATRVNVTINGIPYNDAESQSTFWVNMPDFVTSVQDIQLQRGAGTSTNGSGAFGASLNLRTLTPSAEGYASTSHSIGSFGTRKHNITFGSGIKNGFYAEGRLSKIASDGYIDRASSDLKSFYAEAGFLGKQTAIKALVFGGKEITYQSWYGTPEAVVRGDKAGIQAFIDRNSYMLTPLDIENLNNAGRTYNFYTYDNQVDNYGQDHYQLHVTHKFANNLSGTISGNFTKGKGFYEEFKPKHKLKNYFPNHPDASLKSDVVRRKWLDNDFYALVYSLNYTSAKLNWNVGGGFNKYAGDHFGEIIKHKFQNIDLTPRYYNATGNKEDYSVYGKIDYTFFDKLMVFTDLQGRRVDYKAQGTNGDLMQFDVNKSYNFFNPKAGLSYLITPTNTIYGSVAIANKEPNRDDLTKNQMEPKAEQLVDYEVGYRFNTEKMNVSVNGYYMHYNNQLVLTGALDDTGGAIRENVDKSYRMGVEIEASVRPVSFAKLSINGTWSQNKIKAFNYVVADTQYDPITYEETYLKVTTPYTNTDISFSPSFIGGGNVSFYPTKNLTLSYIQKYVSKQYLDNTSTNSRRLNSYHNGNLSIQYSYKPKNFATIELNLLINNIYNSLYESNGYTYSYYYRPVGSSDNAITENFYYPQAGINFITGLTLKF